MAERERNEGPANARRRAMPGLLGRILHPLGTLGRRWGFVSVIVVILAAAEGVGAHSETGSLNAVDSPRAVVTEWTSDAGPWDGIWQFRSDGGDRTQILPDLRRDPEFVHPDWSPDGSSIVVARGPGTRPPTSIFTTSPDGTRTSTLATCKAACVQVVFPAWSRDGSRVAFSWLDRKGRTAIDIVNVTTKVRRTVFRPAAGVAAETTRWSPDGGSLVLGLNRQKEAYDGPITGSTVALLDLATHRLRILRRWSSFAAYPDWHPTDDLIVFSTHDLGQFQNTNAASNLFTIHSDGTGLRRITNYPPGGTRATQPSWTPGGTSIIFTKVDGLSDEDRHPAFIQPDGSGLVVLAVDGTHNRVRPGGP